jgi:hypothetical protein
MGANMPVTLEKIGIINKSDRTDLEKIYTDYPGDFSFADVASFIENQAGSSLYAGRFNDKLLGAFTLTIDEQHPEQAIIDHLCVREITRQRYVGRDMLRLIMQKMPELDLQLTSCIESQALTALLLQAGFIQHGNKFAFSPSPSSSSSPSSNSN